jgi:SdrD B-like domain/Secretion system C-terminal sorting domain
MKLIYAFFNCFFFLIFYQNVQAQISGSVYRDFNGNGLRTTTAPIEPLVAGITVNVYTNANVLVATTTTTATAVPNYSFTAGQVPFPGNYRVEFSGIIGNDKPSFNGTGNGTNVQFVSATSTTVNFGLNNPKDYSATTNPRYAVSQFIQNGAAATNTSKSVFDIDYNGATASTTLATRATTGTTWGLAYDKKTENIYTSAFLRRHSQLGPLGLGGIYQINYSNPAAPVVTNWLDINSLPGVNVGTTLRPVAVNYAIDAAVFSEVGKIGIGDIDMSDDGDTLFVMNLNNNGQVVVINRNTKALIATYNVPNPGCGSATDVRPFALAYEKGAVYVGVICSGQGTPANKNMYIYKLVNGTFTEVLSSNLNYTKGLVHTGFPTAPNSGSVWETWTDNFADIHVMGSLGGFSRWTRPQAMMTDIEFDVDGTMILGFADRAGFQLGYQQQNVAGTASGNGYIGGDILRTSKTGSTFTLESNGIANAVTATGSGNSQGPGGGEFYSGETAVSDTHQEISNGGLALLPGSGEVLLSAMDPVNNVFSGGTMRLNNTTGNYVAGYESYNATTSTFGKSAGLGDIELLTELQPIQIGNRIWMDTNGNGVQDASELTAGVPTSTIVTLRSPGLDGDYTTTADNQTWTTTTDANGNYYFSALATADNRKPALWTGIGNTLLTGYDYRIEVAIPTGTSITQKDIQTNGLDLIDSDASLNGTNAIVNFNTTSTNHNFDIGFRNQASIGNRVWRDDNNDGIQAETFVGSGIFTEPGVAGITVTLYQNGVVVATTITDAYGNYLFENLAPSISTVTMYNVGFTLPTNYQFTIQTNTQVTGTNNLTNTTTVSSGANLNNGSDVNSITGLTGSFWLAPGENELSVDAGIKFNVPVVTNSIGDKVWFDNGIGTGGIANDGIQNGTEPGVAGVTVTLYNSAGAVIATTVTDAAGNYLFTNLVDGNYKVGFTLPAGMLFTSKDVTGSGAPGSITDGTNDSDINTSGINFGKTDLIDVDAAGTNPNGVTITNVDAGIINQPIGTASLGDKVWNDNGGGALTNNGTQDVNELGIAGVTVNLYEDVNGDGVLTGAELIAVKTAVTDVFGNYIFNGLVVSTINKWQVEFVQPVGYSNTLVLNNNSGGDATDSDIENNTTDRTGFIRLKADERNFKVDAGFVKTTPAGLLKLGDYVWRDNNADGIQDDGESGIAGVTAKLYQNGPDGRPGTNDDILVGTTYTDINGFYLFTDLAASTGITNYYNVQFSNIPDGFSFSRQTNSQSVSGISNAPTGGATNINGNDVNSLGKTGSINLTADNLTIDAGVNQGTPSGKGSIGNKVWVDLTGGTANVQDVNEPGVAGVTVKLYKDINGDGQITGTEATTPFATTTTNELGEYIFDNLDAATYQVGFSTLPVGYALVTANVGTDDNVDSDGNILGTAIAGNTATVGTSYSNLIPLAQGEDNLSIDLGLTPPASTNTLGNKVWWDQNANGLLDVNEQGVPGVVVTLYNSAGAVIGSTTTDANGFYLFVGLANGTYSVGFSNIPAGFTFTNKEATNNPATDIAGSDAEILSGRSLPVTLTFATGGTSRDNRSLDAGIVSTRAALGNKVWDDANGDGIQNVSEVCVAGVTVSLYFDTDGNGTISGIEATIPVATAITDANGNYLFPNLIGGNYQVGFTTIPAGMQFTQQNAAGDNQDNTNSDANPITGLSSLIVLGNSEVDLTVDAGIRRTPVATVGNLVWDDLNGDGIQDLGEPGIPGVIAILYNNLGIAIGSAVTNANGNWLITNVPIGTGYYVQFTNKPAGNFTQQDQAGTTGVTGGAGDTDNDSDANTSGTTGTFDVTPNTINVRIDAGILQSITLPTKFVNFTVNKQNNSSVLNFVIAQAAPSSTFTIERSITGTNFIAIGTVQGTIATSYTYTDITPNQNAKNYYRIKEVDAQGKVTYTEVRIVKFNKEVKIEIYPNPTTSILNIDLSENIVNKSIVITMYSTTGQLVLSTKVANANSTEILDVSKLTAGIYQLRITTNNEVVTDRKIVVTK